MLRHLTTESILRLHFLVISETGGSHGVRDRHALLSLEHAPRQTAFGKELYPTLFLKTAVYIRNIIFSHPFADGNKRTAMVCAGTFLEDNGYLLSVEKGMIEAFALHVVAKKLSIEDIADWLKTHSRKIRT